MIIREFRESDADEVSRLIINNLKTINARDHPRKVVDMLVSHNTPERVIKRSKRDIVLVAEIDNKIVGTGCLKRNRVRNVFVDTKLHKKGIGKKLMNKIEGTAKKQNLNKVYLTSSLYAEGFYKKMGYKKIKKYTELRDGVPIVIIKMEKNLKD